MGAVAINVSTSITFLIVMKFLLISGFITECCLTAI